MHLLATYLREKIAGEGSRKRKSAEALVDEESLRQSSRVINNDDLSFPLPVVNARQVFAESIYVPAEFRCLLSSALMSDPVILTNGQVVDMRSLQNPIATLAYDLDGRSVSILSRDDALMEKWEGTKRKAELRWHLKMLSYSGNHQLVSARELRLMAGEGVPYAEAFADLGPSAALELARPLLTSSAPAPYYLHEDIMRTAALLSEHDPRNRQHLVQHADVVEIIIESLRCGTPSATLTAMKLVDHVTKLPDCRGVLVSSGIVEHLVELMETGGMSFHNHALGALAKLSRVPENRRQMVNLGVVDSVLEDFPPHRDLRDNMSALLRRLSLRHAAVRQLASKSELVCSWLLGTLREAGLPLKTKTCLVVSLSRILPVGKAALVAAYQHEAECQTVAGIIRNGSERAKTAARDIIRLLNSDEAAAVVSAQINRNDSAVNRVHLQHRSSSSRN